MLKTQPLCTSAELNLEDRVLGKIEKTTLLLCQAKGDTMAFCLSKLCIPTVGGFNEEFYSNG